MLKSRKSISLSSLYQSRQNCSNFQQNGQIIDKKYRCECCKDKKYPDYNRQNRLKRQSACLKRSTSWNQKSYLYSSQQNNMNFLNKNMIYSIESNRIENEQLETTNKLSAIQQSPNLEEKELNRDKCSSMKTPIVDMRSYCKNLFSNSKKKKQANRIQVNLNGKIYYIVFDNDQKMKIALGQLKLLIQKSQNQRQKLK